MKFDIIKELEQNNFFRLDPDINIYLHKNSDYIVNLDQIEHTKENLEQILIAANASAKIKKVK